MLLCYLITRVQGDISQTTRPAIIASKTGPKAAADVPAPRTERSMRVHHPANWTVGFRVTINVPSTTPEMHAQLDGIEWNEDAAEDALATCVNDEAMRCMRERIGDVQVRWTRTRGLMEAEIAVAERKIWWIISEVRMM